MNSHNAKTPPSAPAKTSEQLAIVFAIVIIALVVFVAILLFGGKELKGHLGQSLASPFQFFQQK